MVVTTLNKRKIENLSKGELDDLKEGAIEDIEDRETEEIEDKYDEENEESEDESSEDSQNSDDDDSLDGDKDEFEDGDTSDEEDRRNTIGNIPIEWYDHLGHIGYDLDGKKIARPIKSKDEIDDLLAKCEDPNYWKRITDRTTLRDHELTQDEIDFIKRLTESKFSSKHDDTPEWTDLYSHEVEIHPINRAPESKRSFVPSYDERAKVNKLAHLIRRGIVKTRKQREEEAAEKNATKYYDVWEKRENELRSKSQLSRERMAYPAPKLPLPGHSESYRPPPEFIFDEEEKLKWESAEQDERRFNFMPTQFPNLRTVPAYNHFLKERFERCLDLYLAPRQRKMKMNVNKEDLIPKLPSPKDLQPFPTFQAVLYEGHEGWVRSISVHSSGQFLVSGGDDCTMRVWEVSTGRCLRKIQFEEKVRRVAWCPNNKLYLIAVGVGSKVCLINPYIGDRRIIEATNQVFETFEEDQKWKISEINGVKIEVLHDHEILDICWHSKGDYFGVISGISSKTDVWFHQISTRKSSKPFSKTKGIVQRILFHPTRLLFYVATQRFIKVFNLGKQEMQRKLEPNVKWISDMAIHSSGDHIIVGDYSTRLAWIDTDLSQKPFKTLRYHKKAIRSVQFHEKYPLFCSGSDDGTIIVSHGRVYNDLATEPLIVPVKVLKGIKTTKNYGVLDVKFHPNHPWVFGAGVDGSIRLYT